MKTTIKHVSPGESFEIPDNSVSVHLRGTFWKVIEQGNHFAWCYCFQSPPKKAAKFTYRNLHNKTQIRRLAE